jgi:general secretion pathway protein G
VSGGSKAWSIVRRVLTVIGTAFATLLVLGLLLTFVIAEMYPLDRHQRRDRTKLDIAQLDNALKLYRARTGHYPDSAVGFDALVDVQIVDKLPRDGWGNFYRYELVDGRPVITSFGADGLPGGEGDNADISNATTQVSSR